MFAKRNRLGSAGFASRSIKKTNIGPFLVRFGKNNTEENRFATVVSLKFEKSAAKRHIWQRHIRERLKTWPKLGLDVIVSPLQTAKESGAKEASRALLLGYKALI